jgi:hypothetical protein
MNAIAKVEPSALLSVIEKAAADPNVDVDKMERLMNMARQVQADRAKVAFNTAFNECQSEIGVVATDSNNTQTKSKYASYAALDKALRPIYTKHGFSLSFDTGTNAPADHVEVLAKLAHKEGHTESYRAVICADGKGAKGGDVMTKTHAVGSAMSYGMRYLLKLIFNVAVGEDDDDGNSAGSKVETLSEKQQADMRALLDECPEGAERRMLGYYKVDNIAKIPASEYGYAMKRLEQNRADHA